MIQAGPDTRTIGWDGCSGYHYSDSLILGFTHTHLSGVGCLDYGDRAVQELVIDLHHRDRLLGARLEKVGNNSVHGWRQSRSWAKSQDVYFYAEFSEPVECFTKSDSAFARLSFAGKWQGYRHNDVDVILDLLGTRKISCVCAEFLQDMDNYIWMPKDMEVYVSSDGKDFKLVGKRLSDVAIDDSVVRIANWKVEFPPVEAAYVRVIAHHFGEIPSWHRGYGDKGFTFIDEITVE